MIQVEWSDYSSIMPDMMQPPVAPAIAVPAIEPDKFNTTDAVDRHGYRLAHFLQKMQTTGCKSFFTVCHINVSCSEIGNTQMFCFPGFCHGMDGSTKNREGSKTPEKTKSLFQRASAAEEGADGWMCSQVQSLPSRTYGEYKEHHICDRCPTPVQQVPDNSLPPDLFPAESDLLDESGRCGQSVPDTDVRTDAGLSQPEEILYYT